MPNSLLDNMSEQIEFDSFDSSEQVYCNVPNESILELRNAAKLLNLLIPDDIFLSCNHNELVASILQKLIILARKSQDTEELEIIVSRFYFSLTLELPKLNRRNKLMLRLRRIFCCL